MEKMNILCNFVSPNIYHLCDINESFAKGNLKIMYLGDNRNDTHFDKEAVAKAAMSSLKNIPIVANYSYKDNMIGGHDSEVVDINGGLKLINKTEPCGVVPESAKWKFEIDVDEYGEEHEYLVVEGVILWKRQAVFEHISKDLDGHVDHSMEIDIISKSYTENNKINIDDFKFTALCLLERDTPCFEGSELILYSQNNQHMDFNSKLEEMINELKQLSCDIARIYDFSDNQNKEEGGNKLEDILENTTEEVVTQDIQVTQESDVDVAEQTNDTEVVSEVNDIEVTSEIETEVNSDTESNNSYALAGDFERELITSLHEEKFVCEWGDTFPRYSFVDYDSDKCEVYANDEEDWNLYGFKYQVDGDTVVVDFESKTRKKIAIVDFENGTQGNNVVDNPVSGIYNAVAEKLNKFKNIEEQYNTCKQEMLEITSELEELRKYKTDIETTNAANTRKELFNEFSDLQGEQGFEDLVANAASYSIEELEEKCYALRGRKHTAKYSYEAKAPKIIVEKDDIYQQTESIPYDGVIEKYSL